MRRIAFSGLALLIAMSALAEGRTRAANRPLVDAGYATPVTGPWRIELKTSGGITGAGSGDMTIDSTGKITVEKFLPGGKTCEFTLTPDELAQVNALIISIHPDLWFASYVPADRRELCCDMIFAQITIERSELVSGSTTPQTATYETQLLTGKIRRETPRDLVDLWNAIAGSIDGKNLKYRYQSQCASRP